MNERSEKINFLPKIRIKVVSWLGRPSILKQGEHPAHGCTDLHCRGTHKTQHQGSGHFHTKEQPGSCARGSHLCLFLQGVHIFIVKPQRVSAHISSAELSPVKFPFGCSNRSQRALDWSLKAVVFAALRHRSGWGFFVPRQAGLCTQFCSKLSSALHRFKCFSTGCMGACNVL